MRAELIVILVVFILAGIVDWFLCAASSEADCTGEQKRERRNSK